MKHKIIRFVHAGEHLAHCSYLLSVAIWAHDMYAIAAGVLFVFVVVHHFVGDE